MHSFEEKAAQCVGRVIRSKLDYGLMIFADSRYSRSDKRKKLPQWLSHYLKTEYINLSTDVAVDISTKFVKKMAQPHSKKDEIGKSLLSLNHIQKKLKKFKEKYKNDDTFEQNQFAQMDINFSSQTANNNNDHNINNRNNNSRMQIDND